MLTQMYVKNFILMDQVNLDFHDHMSAFTGETGAGKSLLMDAIGILKGERISASMVKEGTDKAIIEGVFTFSKAHRAYGLLYEAGYDVDDGTLIVTREFTKEGKSTARINQRPTSVSFLKEVVSTLVDLHSQHDTQYLLNAKYHLGLLDSFCNKEQLKQTVKERYQNYKHMYDELQLALHQDYNEDDLEFLTFQLNEIDEADIHEGELEELEDELKRMQAFEKITASVSSAVTYLEDGCSNALYDAYKEVHAIHEDDTFLEVAEKLLDAYYVIDDNITIMKSYIETMEYDEQHFHEVQERIFLVHKIMRKYGPDLSDVLQKREELERKIDSILHRQDFITKQETMVKDAKDKFDNEAWKLHEKRKKEAKKLESLILKQLKDLQLPNAQFCVDIQTFDGNATGIDKVEFLISMNAGERLKSLSTTASGGELSRFMLGLKSVFTRLQGIETIIFDEIDTGVSGSVAFSIGRKMKALASDTQVFCVTHLAPVAACSQYHYKVEKAQDNQKTSTTIHLLDEKERILELAAISSSSASKTALDAAKELYDKANTQ